MVDTADYVFWRKNPGGTYTQVGYNTWRTHFGQSSSLAFGATAGLSSSASPLHAAVPEPLSIAHVFAAVAYLALFRRIRAPT